MKLVFDHSVKVSKGDFPNIVQFHDTSAEIFSVTGGSVYGTPIYKVNGDYTNPKTEASIDVSPDHDVSNLSIQTLPGFGIIGAYKTGDYHKLIIYEFEHDISKHLVNGSIQHNIDTPVSSFRLTLKNINELDPDAPILINEDEAILTPGSKISFNFGMGDDYTDYEIGSFYVDRVNFNVGAPTLSVDGRNLIGKALKDQTLNDDFNIPYGIFSDCVTWLLEKANLNPDQYFVQYDTNNRRYTFDPSKDSFSALEEMCNSMVDWKIEELVTGEIVIGNKTFSAFPKRNTYTFERNKDIFSRNISMDDQESYRKVCVHDSEWTVKIYKDVKSFTGWNLNSNKTMFIEIPKGMKVEEADALALDIAGRLEKVGKMESFDGPIRPHVLIGDGATIRTTTDTELGLITEVSHEFGENGFSTSITVDSGGRLGKGRLSDYIKMLDNKQKTGSIAYEDIPPED